MNDHELRRLVVDHQERSKLLVAAFEAAEPRQRKDALLADFRCRVRRCSLLLAWRAPGGDEPLTLVRLSRYKLSADRTVAETSSGARAKNTSDGYRHWNGRVIILNELAGWPNVAVDLNCDHYRGRLLVDDLIGQLIAARPGKPLERFLPS